VLDPARTNLTWCAPDEHMLACEIRLHNPSFLFIRLGTNDASSADVLKRNLQRIVSFASEQGVIPILATKADRFEEEYNQNNEAIRQLAAEMHLPLWDFDRVAATLPNHGLLADGVHLTHAPRNDYTKPETFSKGYPMSDFDGVVCAGRDFGSRCRGRFHQRWRLAGWKVRRLAALPISQSPSSNLPDEC
jgi:hypothetical protein